MVGGGGPARSCPVLDRTASRRLGGTATCVRLGALGVGSEGRIGDVVGSTNIRSCGMGSSMVGTGLSFSPGKTVIRAVVPVTDIILIVVVVTKFVLVCGTFKVSLRRHAECLKVLTSINTAGRRGQSSICFRKFVLNLVNVPININTNVLKVAVALGTIKGGVLSDNLTTSGDGISFGADVP